MCYVNQVVQDCGLYLTGVSGLWAIFNRCFRTVGYINQLVQDLKHLVN